jgi:hypothetical protein
LAIRNPAITIKKIKENLDFLSLKTDVNVTTVSKKQKIWGKT